MRTRLLLGSTLVSTLLAATAVVAAPDREGVISPIDAIHPDDHRHGGRNGHLPAETRNVDVVGELDLFGDDEQPGRVSDVAAFGNYAYLGQWQGEGEECRSGGVYVVDISDPTKPEEAAFIPASPNTYVGEGVQVFKMRTRFFKGPVLVHNNENCIVGGAAFAGRGGASLWDVRKPEEPQPLAEHFGDVDPTGSTDVTIPHQSHSAFGWQQGKRAYVVMVDNGELGTTDIDIFDVTNPAEPELVLETGMDDFPRIQEVPSPNGSNSFIHDMIVEKVGGRYLMLASYWDGGYLILDVTNLGDDSLPDEKRAELVRESDFGAVEPYRDRMNLPRDWTPEGNAHQAEFNSDASLFLGADEDFSPRRLAVTVESGRHRGESGSATLGDDVPAVRPNRPIAGPTRFLGDGCLPATPAPSPEHVAVIERGTCTFTVKAQNAQQAGYAAAIIFNAAQPSTGEHCTAQVFMDADAAIPALFVGRDVGLQALNQEFQDPCSKGAPAPGTAGADVTISARFDGWGYVHVYDARTMDELATWALPEALDESHATGSGDLSIHEVATDPRRNIAYVSHYSGGFRVLRFSRSSVHEVGAFIARGGSNFWGVQVHRLPGSKRPLVLASDRDAGLWILRYDP